MSGFADTLEQEGAGLVGAATDQGLIVRLLGGIGIQLLLGDDLPPRLRRRCGDLDVICSRPDARGLEALAAARGWAPAAEFNALNGARRLLFHDPRSEAQIDVFVGGFHMCHELPLLAGLDAAAEHSLAATELLMTKLQIVQLNAKDRNDLYALLLASAAAPGDPRRIDAGRLTHATGTDWGLHHTFERNFAELGRQAGDVLEADATVVVRAEVARLRQAMEAAPKSRGWRLRARVGERKRWYDEPEEVDRDPA